MSSPTTHDLAQLKRGQDRIKDPLALTLLELAVEQERRIAVLETELDEARSAAQHLLECARGEGVIGIGGFELPEWLDDPADDEEGEE